MRPIASDAGLIRAYRMRVIPYDLGELALETCDLLPINENSVARGGIEPSTRGFSGHQLPLKGGRFWPKAAGEVYPIQNL